jgi:hypothetical protein
MRVNPIIVSTPSMSAPHRYNTRFQLKKNAAARATPTYQAPTVPPPIKLPEECPKAVFKTPAEAYEEIQRILNLAQNAPLNSATRYEHVIELFMFILANQQHVKYHKRLVTVIRERVDTFSKDVERTMKNSVWQDSKYLPNLCPQHMKDEAQRLVLCRIMKTLFNHIKVLSDQWIIDMNYIHKMSLNNNNEWQRYE